LRAELGEDAPRQGSWPALVAALGFLPLALHLAAGHLRADHRADAFLRRLRAKNLALTSTDPADPTFRDRSRALFRHLRAVARSTSAGGRRGGRRLASELLCAGARARGRFRRKPWYRDFGALRRGVRGHGIGGIAAVVARRCAARRRE